jgi:hypothetical protein
MRVIKYQNGKHWETEYPNDTMQPVDRLAAGIVYCIIETAEMPQYDVNTHTHKMVETLDFTPREDYPHMGTCRRSYEVYQLPNESIVAKLNNSLGEHLDSNYPLWQRQKHDDEIKYLEPTPERIEYIKSLKIWEFGCRNDRDKREQELINNNTLPSFEWEPKP